jgi:hypothetical protein
VVSMTQPDLFKDYAPLIARREYRRSYGHGRVRAFRRLVLATARAL